MARRKTRASRASKRSVPFYASLFLLVVLVLFALVDHFRPAPAGLPVSDGALEIHTIDVGQGDSILLRSAAGNVLIDAGTSASEEDLKRYLQQLGVTELEYAVFTHPHEDHIGGADMVVSDFTVRHVIMPDAPSSSATYGRLLDALERSGAEVHPAVSGEKYAVGDLRLTVLAPNSAQYDETNNYSVVLRADYGDTSFLFAGDAETLSEREILERHPALLDCDVLKVGHHGSSGSSCKEFLAAVSPSIALISCGRDNTYGHPHTEALERLADVGAEVFRTDQRGSLVFTSDGKQIEYRTAG